VSKEINYYTVTYSYESRINLLLVYNKFIISI